MPASPPAPTSRRARGRATSELSNGRGDIHEQMYAEAPRARKGAIRGGKGSAGGVLLRHADVSKLTNRCEVFEALCNIGVAVCPNTLRLRGRYPG